MTMETAHRDIVWQCKLCEANFAKIREHSVLFTARRTADQFYEMMRLLHSATIDVQMTISMYPMK